MTQPFPIIGSYDVQRFRQFSPEDCANWTMTPAPTGKKKMALYPTLGRKHINYLGQNKLIFPDEPRGIFRTSNYWYVVVDSNIYQIDSNYNQILINPGIKQLRTLSGNVYFTALTAVNATFAVFTDGQKIYVYQEAIYNSNGSLVYPADFEIVTDPNAPQNPTYIATFGNRIVCGNFNSSQFNLSQIFLGGIPWSAAEAAVCFTIANQAVFAQESGIIKQMGVINNTLYIFTDFTTGIWSEIPSQLIPAFGESAVTFPFKKSSTYNWDFGIADSDSLDSDFNMLVWLAQNQNGLVQVMVSKGGLPERLSTKAIDVLFQRYANAGNRNPFLNGGGVGFLYQYENTIYYRISAGNYDGNQILDQEFTNNSLEYNFDSKQWTRVIELNGQRCRIQRHVFFNNVHFVTVQGDGTVYQMAGNIYSNEMTNPAQDDPQQPDAYLIQPFRYEKVTPIISEEDYSEFITDYVQIDFVWGEHTFINTDTPFANAVFIIDEAASPVDGSPQFMVAEDNAETFIIQEGTNTPDANSPTYNALFKPHVELYWSDNGGMTYEPADVREFSQLGVYSWRMRWYQLGPSRNRCYKLICVSPAPIVILGGVMETRRVSGGAN